VCLRVWGGWYQVPVKKFYTEKKKPHKLSLQNEAIPMWDLIGSETFKRSNFKTEGCGI